MILKLSLLTTGLAMASATKTGETQNELRRLGGDDWFDWGGEMGSPVPHEIDWGSFIDELVGEDLDICPLLESAVGIGESFGVGGDCTCEGEFGDGLAIDCAFEHECVPNSEGLCGAVGLNFTFADLAAGAISTSMCVDMDNDEYERFCFTYEMDMSASFEQTCTAFYGSDECDCQIDDFCFLVDCSSFLPGAKMDTCQSLSYESETDISTFLPAFQRFSADFDEFDFDNIDWGTIDWGNLDWNNFDWADVEWGSHSSEAWDSLFNDDTTIDVICPILSDSIGMGDDFHSEGECECDGVEGEGFTFQCSFQDTCTDDNEVCGSVEFSFGFSQLDSVQSSVCVDYDDDSHPRTCYSYDIPFASEIDSPACQATYGDEECSCEIDENFCVKIDCSDHATDAVMDTCQEIKWGEVSTVSQTMPRFAEETDPKGDPNGANNPDDDGSSSPRISAIAGVAATVSLTVGAFL